MSERRWVLCELRIAHRRKKENGKPQSSDRLCKNLTKYSSPVIEAWSAARSSANSEQEGFANLVTRDRAQLDLRNEAEVDRFFAEEKPAMVVFAAAKVGGHQGEQRSAGGIPAR